MHLSKGLKLKMLTPSLTEWDKEKLGFHTLLAGMQNGTTALEMSLAISFEMKYAVTV